jgi:hypothetical protein
VTAPAPPIVFARLPGGRGALWLRQSYGMASAHRVRWLLLLLIYYPLLGLIDLVPLVGQIAVPLLKPVFAVGFLAAAWAQERGGAPGPAQLFEGFRSNLRALLPLGAFLIVGITLAVFASTLVDGGKLIGFLTNPPAPADGGDATAAETVLGDPRVQGGMLLAVACGLPVVMALWFAPALVVFQDCGARQALATSFRAALANWRPLAVYAALLFFWGGVVPGLAAALISALVPRSAALAVAAVALIPYVLLFTATLHISDYVAYRDIFHPGEGAPTAAPAPGAGD